MFVGDNFTIVAVTSPEGLNVTFVPDDSGVYSVDDNGVVTALKEGTGNILVKVGDDKKYALNSTTVAVSVSKMPTTIKPDMYGYVVYVDDTRDNLAVLLDKDGNNVTDDYTLTYASSNESVVKIVGDSFVAVSEGIVTVTVSFNGTDKYEAAQDVEFNVAVLKIPAKIIVENDTADIKVDEIFDPVVSLMPSDAGNLTFTSSNESVVKIVDGAFVAVSVGSATVTVSFNGTDKYAAAESKNITVSVSLIDAAVSVNNDTLDLFVGDNFTIVAVTSPEGLNVTFVPDDSGVYSVDDNGVVTALKEGTGNILVKVGDDKKYALNSTTVAVSVSKIPTEITVENTTLELLVDDVVNCGADLTPEGAGNLTYTSSNESVVIVEDGKIKALGEGSATVTVSFNGTDKYAASEANITVNVNPVPIPKENLTLEAAVEPITAGENATIIVTGLENATGNVSARVGNGVYFAPIENGIATITVSGLIANDTALIAYDGDDKYNAANTTVDIVVNPKPKENATMNIDAPPVTEGQNTTVNVELPEDATGNVTVTLDSKNYTAPVKDGKATITIPELVAGNYTLPVTYSGDDKYNPVTKEVNVTVEEDKSDIISAPDVTKYYNGSERFNVSVTDYQGNPLANKTVTILINGVTYTRTTDANGSASMALRLNSGVYNVTSTVDNETVNSSVTVLPTVNGTDVVKMYMNGTQYFATFLDSEGNFLADGTAVKFNINGVMYERKISGGKGQAKLNIKLEQGEYVITAMNPVTGENAANNITVLSLLTENRNLTKYYRNASQYTVKVLGQDGKVVGAGETVKFNINGVFYERQTNASGIAKLNINLQPGDYIITAEYNNCSVSNNIKVLPVLTADDMIKKYGTQDQFVATLVDGQGKAYANQNIIFNINGVFYSKLTDSNGQAKLNINLTPGEYIITSSYNETNIANNITVKS